MSTTESRRPAGGAARRLARMRRRYLSFAAPITLAMALVLGASALIAETHTARTASAAEIPGAITSVSIAEESTTYYADFEVDLTWSVPDSATAGDTFSFVLPHRSSPTPTGSISVTRRVGWSRSPPSAEAWSPSP